MAYRKTLQQSIESVVANSSVPLDFLVEGQVNVLETVHPLPTSNFINTWFFRLHMKRKTLSSVMIGRQKRREAVVLAIQYL